MAESALHNIRIIPFHNTPLIKKTSQNVLSCCKFYICFGDKIIK